MHRQKIALIGVGLLGGSLGLAIRKHQLAGKVSGHVRRLSSIEECLRCGVVDEASTDLEQTVRDADLIVICTPVAQMAGLVLELSRFLKPGALVTDVGSVKASVVEQLEPLVENAGGHFVGSHPMCGAEKTGVAAARANLFEGGICVVTPTSRSLATAVSTLAEFWSDLGCRVLRLSPEMHDDLVSRSSHLPHVVAAALANYVLSPVHPTEQSLLCANGFRDTTRIASSSPEMWRDIALANRANLTRALGVFIEDLQEFCEALQNNDAKSVHDFFDKAKQRRDQWRDQAASSSE